MYLFMLAVRYVGRSADNGLFEINQSIYNDLFGGMRLLKVDCRATFFSCTGIHDVCC